MVSAFNDLLRREMDVFCKSDFLPPRRQPVETVERLTSSNIFETCPGDNSNITLRSMPDSKRVGGEFIHRHRPQCGCHDHECMGKSVNVRRVDADPVTHD